MPWKGILPFADIEPEKAPSHSGDRARGDQETTEQVGYSPRVSAETKILQALQPDPSQEWNQQQKGRN
jgi:hypothetical protein